MKNSLVDSTKKVIRFLDKHKIDILKGVVSAMTITFTNGKLDIQFGKKGYPNGNYRSYHAFASEGSAEMAIDSYLESAMAASWDSDRESAAERIANVIRSGSNVQDSTKRYALTALGKIKREMRWGSGRDAIDDLIDEIVTL